MESIAQSNVFFIITSIAVIIITLFIIVLLWYGIKIVRNIFFVSNKIKQGTEHSEKQIKKILKMFK